MHYYVSQLDTVAEKIHYFVNQLDIVAEEMRYFVNRFPAWSGGEIATSEQVWLPKIKEIIANILANQVSSLMAIFLKILQCCGSGIRCLCYPWIRDPGSWTGKNQNLDRDSNPGRTSRIIFPRAWN